MGVAKEPIIPWGRSRREYELMFDLSPAHQHRRTLDCGGGPASFNAEMTQAGQQIISVDPLYSYTASEIATRYEATSEPMAARIRASPHKLAWGYHKGPDELLEYRRKVFKRFLSDYEQGRSAGRYQAGSLPNLSFSDRAFDLALCSHLLFFYSDLLSEEFHIKSVLELCRVANEVRIFPISARTGKPVSYVGAVRDSLKQAGCASEIVRVKYELQKGAHHMLRIWRGEGGENLVERKSFGGWLNLFRRSRQDR